MSGRSNGIFADVWGHQVGCYDEAAPCITCASETHWTIDGITYCSDHANEYIASNNPEFAKILYGTP